jgi:hypothetical protein
VVVREKAAHGSGGQAGATKKVATAADADARRSRADSAPRRASFAQQRPRAQFEALKPWRRKAGDRTVAPATGSAVVD